eukprot:6212367-Pleurochrysis_carterae.AAC.3
MDAFVSLFVRCRNYTGERGRGGRARARARRRPPAVTARRCAGGEGEGTARLVWLDNFQVAGAARRDDDDDDAHAQQRSSRQYVAGDGGCTSSVSTMDMWVKSMIASSSHQTYISHSK